MGAMAITWTQFEGLASAITGELTTTALLGILAGVVGVTIAYTLIWRFAGYIRNVVTGGLTNSKRRRR